MQQASHPSTGANLVVCEGTLYCQRKKSWSERYAKLTKCSKENEGCLLAIFKRKGSKLKIDSEIYSEQISEIEIHSEDISSGKNQLFFKILFNTKEHPLCLYADTHEEISNWVASLLVAVSKGKLYHVKHYSDGSTHMQHSILYFTNAYNKTTGEKELTLILSSPLDGSKIRKRWQVNSIKQCVQFDAGIKIVLCPACYKPGREKVSLEFILFVPSNNATECIEFICQNSCFTLDSLAEGIGCCKNFEHDKICLEKSQDNVVETTGTNTSSSSNIVSDHNTTDADGEKVRDDSILHQPENQGSTALTESAVHESPIEGTQTCGSDEKDTCTTQSRSNEPPPPRSRAHTYEEITVGTCKADRQCPVVMQTPGTLHRNIVKVAKTCTTPIEEFEDTSTSIKPSSARKTHIYEQIPLDTTTNPVHLKGGHVYYEIRSVMGQSTGEGKEAFKDTKYLEVLHDTSHLAHANINDSSESEDEVPPYAVSPFKHKPTQDISESTQKPSSAIDSGHIPIVQQSLDSLMSQNACDLTSSRLLDSVQNTPLDLQEPNELVPVTDEHSLQQQFCTDTDIKPITEVKQYTIDHQTSPVPLPRKKKTELKELRIESAQYESGQNCGGGDGTKPDLMNSEPKEIIIKPVPTPRKKSLFFSNIEDTVSEKHEANKNFDEADGTMSKIELKETSRMPTPKPRRKIPCNLSSKDTTHSVNEELDECNSEDQRNTRKDYNQERNEIEEKPVPKPRIGRSLSDNDENYTKLVPYRLVMDYHQDDKGYVKMNSVIVNESSEKSYKPD